MPIKFFLTGTLFALAMLLSGCGSDGGTTGGGGTAVPVVSGTVAIGAPLEADITVKGVVGSTTTRSNASGEFTADVRGMTAPFVLKAQTADGRILYSMADYGEIHANITPLTSYVVDQIAVNNGLGGGAWQIFSKVGDNISLFSKIPEEVNALNTILATEMQAANVAGFNHLTQAFNADQTGYDAFLDSLDIEMHNDDLVIHSGTTVLDTLSYTLPTGTLTVTGRITDANTQVPVSGATLTFANAQGNFTATTNGNGLFSVDLNSHRVYDITITASGFESVVYYNLATFSQNPISTESIQMVRNSDRGEGTINGQIINARTLTPLNNVSLTFRSGINNRAGTAVATTTANADGNYTLPIASGVYTINFEKAGFTDVYRNAVVIDAQTLQMPTIPMITSTIGGNSFATMVLTWGENPADLDTFLTGPSTQLDSTSSLNGERFKLAYYQKTFSTSGGYEGEAVANKEDPCATTTLVAGIDVDDVTSYGPETTTLCQVEPGIYSYYIHHFSGDSTMSDSPAVVAVTTASGISNAFIAPAGAVGSNTDLWHVFDLDNYGNLTPVNKILTGGDAAALSAAFGDSSSSVPEGLLDDLPAK